MKRSVIYTIAVAAVFLTYTVVFATFERSTYSELEKRELASFPAFSIEKLADGSYTKEISAWFSDSEPFRDVFMTQSMYIKDCFKLTLSDDDVVIHATEDRMDDGENDNGTATAAKTEEEQNGIMLDENAKIASKGIIIVGKDENTRALMAYGGSSKAGGHYAETINMYKETFGGVNVYCMVIPTAIEFYCPEKAKGHTNKELPTINNIHSRLAPGVKAVDAYFALKEHAGENIYLRTDHHWAPLGAYYAAQVFAKVAGVPFKDLSNYEEHVVKGYVGSMYGYSKDISIKKAPEDFVYHIPKGVRYTTTYTNYTIDENYNVTAMSKPFNGTYFFRFKNGSGGAYCTFMGGDTKITKVKTSTGNGRRLIILKDSFGNPIPGYLFFSFEEIHVIDYRYFTRNMRAYVSENNITDILFANNVFPVCSSSTGSKYRKFLTQSGEIIPPKKDEEQKNDSVAKDAQPAAEQQAKQIKDTVSVVQQTENKPVSGISGK